MKSYKTAMSFGLMLLAGSILILTPTRSHAESVLYAIDNEAPFLSVVNPLTGAEVSSIAVSLANETILNQTGLSVSPVTNEMYAAVKLASQAGPGRNLVIINPETGVATNIGPMGQPIASLAFDGNGVLYAVSGDCLRGCGGAAIAETLFTVNTNNAMLTMVQTLGNGNDGEAIAFNPTDGMMYHMSGVGGEDLIFEKINLGNGVVTPIPLSGGAVTDLEAIGFTFDPGKNLFVGSLIDCGCEGSQRSFISISSDGFITHVNPLVIWWKDYAFLEVSNTPRPSRDLSWLYYLVLD